MQGLFIRTDQRDCYNAQGNVISCWNSSQDGSVEAGTAWPEPRFADHGDTVLDYLTGLMWTKNASLTEFPLSWQEALSFVNKMDQSRMFGFNKWKLPTRRQLFSLVSHMQINPTLPKGHPFTNVFNGYYWSRTEVCRYPAQAWYVHFGGGRVSKGMKHGSYMVWPVRKDLRSENQEGKSEEDFPRSEGRFVDKGETVVDRSTGLEWTKDANPISNGIKWTTALEAVDIMNEERAYGHSDWRLPNIRELECLVYTGSHSPALLPEHPFKKVQKFYWSSTTSTYEPTYAWVLYMEDGAVGVGFKDGTDFFVWPVRSGI